MDVHEHEKSFMSEKENLIRIFKYALNQEETGKSFFETSLKRMNWGATADAFSRLIKEEEHHIRFIKGILDALQEGRMEALGNLEDQEKAAVDFFDERARTEFLQERLYESMVPDVTIFNVAWLIEKDLSEFYEKMAKRTKGNAREAFKMLSAWEKGHESFFRDYRDKLTEIYGELSWGG
jgi:rubrerythrin